MATMLGSLLISLGLDSGQFRSGMTQAERELVKFQKQTLRTANAMKDLGARMTVGITAPLIAFGGFAAKAASDAAELQSAFEVTFGGAAASVQKWAEETGDAMGRSTQEMMGMAASFQDILKKQMDPAAAAELSKNLTVLTQDLASFKNLSNEVAQQKIFSGLIGEAEPLRSVGVLLDAASVNARAFEMGLAKSTKEVSEGAKVQARAAIIMEQLADAQGDVIRTADSTANRVKTASAAFEEMQVAIGKKLIPAITPLIAGVTALIEAFTALPDWVQTSAIAILGVAAVAGPLIFVTGSLIANLTLLGGAFAASGAAATGASAGVTLLTATLRGLMLVGGPLLLALGAIAGAVWLYSKRNEEASQASAVLTGEQDKLARVQSKATTVTQQLATATGAARKAAVENAMALREETKQYLASARAAAQAARAKLAEIKAKNLERLQTATRSTAGAGSGYDPALGQIRRNNAAERAARREIMELEKVAAGHAKKLYEIEQALKAPPPSVSVPAVEGNKPKPSTKKTDTGPTPEEIAARFADEQLRLEMETLQAKERLATTLRDRVDMQLDQIELEREARLRDIEASEYSEEQKAALREQVEALYGKAAQVDEQGRIIAHATKGLLAQAVINDETAELEARARDALQIQFDTRRDLLEIDYDLADTGKERQRIAAEILRLEQEYRRNQLEMTVASEASSEAEKKRAAAILASLDALEAGERAASGKANRTATQRYIDDLNMSAAEINEAIDGITMDGLDALNDGLVDAIMGVKSLGEVFKNIASEIIADLLRISIRRAIIAPLANSLFPGGGSFLDGARAMGGPVLAGGRYLVGENGPEIFEPHGSGRIIPNHALQGMAGGSTGGGGWTGDMIVKAEDPSSFNRSQQQIDRKLRRRMNGR